MAFSSSRIFRASPKYIAAIASDVQKELRREEYEVQCDKLIGGNVDLSICKGGFFKSIVGMKTALKITFIGLGDRFRVDCKVGIFGQQAIPTVISMLFFWPVLITQIWGLVKQSKLDDHVLDLVEQSLNWREKEVDAEGNPSPAPDVCPKCGVKATGAFCYACGAKLQ